MRLDTVVTLFHLKKIRLANWKEGNRYQYSPIKQCSGHLKAIKFIRMINIHSSRHHQGIKNYFAKI